MDPLRLMGRTAAIVGLVLLSAWVGAARPGQEPFHRGGTAAAIAPRLPGREPGSADTSRPEQPGRDRMTDRSQGERSVRAEPMAAAPARGSHTPAAGRTGGGTMAKAATSERTAQTGGENTQSASTADMQEKDTAKSGVPRPPKESRITERRSTEKEADSGAGVGKGASGGGSMAAVQHSWSQRAQTVEGKEQEESSDEDVEDEAEESRQRGGIQPSLKDRNESPSRDLSISGEQGPPGSGRGGPTPPKKSRGTASLVLGIPIPDFVRGRLGPGTTKITHERVEPTPMPGEPAQPGPVSPRVRPERPVWPVSIPPNLAEAVRNYLIALHSADAQATEEGLPVTAPESGASQTEESSNP